MYRIKFAGNGYMEIPTWYGVAGDTVSFEMTPASLAAWDYILFGAGSAYVALEGGELRFSGSSLVSITLATPIVIGTTYTIVVEVPDVSRIGANSTGAWQFNGSITNLTFTSSVAGNSRDYSRHPNTLNTS